MQVRRRRLALRVTGALLIVLALSMIALTRSVLHRPAGTAPSALPRLEVVDPDGSGRNPAREAYEDRAYPRGYVSAAQVKRAETQVAALPTRLGTRAFAPGTPDVQARTAVASTWQFAGPDVPFAPGPTTESLKDSVTSGRVTALVVSPDCGAAGNAGDCRAWVATAGGGIWRTDHALAESPRWTAVDSGLPTNTFGALVLDPADRTGNTIYAGLGEANSLNQAGLGLYRSTDGGDSWTLVPGSYAIAQNRSISSIRFGANHAIWLGTTPGSQGQSSANGGAVVPPGTAEVAVWKSTDNGATFRLSKSMAPKGTIGGGVNDIEVDPADPNRVYAAFYGYGVWRTTDNGATWEQVFTPTSASTSEREEIAVTRKNGATRIYLGNGVSGSGHLFRVDDASAPASTLDPPATPNSGWTDLSSPVNGTPGYASYNLCQGQCNYDLFVEADPRNPDTVWFGGSMVYEEIRPLQDQSLIGVAPNRSNGRAVMRSTDAGVHFTDMTADATGSPTPLGPPYYEQMHPDQHALAFDPANPSIAFVGSDGGVVRTDGTFVDKSGECSSRDGMRNASAADAADCQQWLSAVPGRILNLNAGLATIQFNSLSVDPRDANGELMGGTQDNGTFAFSNPNGGTSRFWFETVNGDGGPSAFDVGNPNVRLHTYFTGFGDINFHGTDPNYWSFVTQPITNSAEPTSFYTPVLGDPVVAGTMFVAAAHIWRTLDDGGNQSQLEAHCRAPGGVPEYDGQIVCGDYKPMGTALTSNAFGPTRAGQYAVAVERAPADRGTMWAATRLGRVFVTKNADAADPQDVQFVRIDSASTPNRFPSGIAIDPADPNHAYVSYSGYYAGNAANDVPGHVFDVRYDPAARHATFTDISGDLPDAPVTDVAYDNLTGDLYAGTDYGVLRRPAGSTSWTRAADGFPPVSTPGLTIVPQARVLYAATYGRSIWKLPLPAVPPSGNPLAATPPAASGEGAAVAPAAVKVAAPLVTSRTVRVSRTRIAAIGLSCGVSAGSHCTGTLTATSSHRLGARSFSIAADRTRTVQLRLTPSAYRSLVRHHRLLTRLALTTRGADGVVRRARASVTLVAPKGVRL